MRNKHFRIFVDPTAELPAGVTWTNFISNAAYVPYTIGLFDSATQTSIDMAALTAATLPNESFFAMKLDTNVTPDVPYVKQPGILAPDRIKYATTSTGQTGQNQIFIVTGFKNSPLNAFCLKLSIYPDQIWPTHGVHPAVKTWCGADECLNVDCNPCQEVTCYKGAFELWRAMNKDYPDVQVEIGTYDSVTNTFSLLPGPLGAPGDDEAAVWAEIENQVAADPNFCPSLRVTLNPYTTTTQFCNIFEYEENPYYFAVLSGHYALECGGEIIEVQQHTRSVNTGWEIARAELADPQFYQEFYTIESITGFISPFIKQRANINAIYDKYTIVYNPMDAGFSDVTLFIAVQQGGPALPGVANVISVLQGIAKGELANAK